jgi:hypothetical protein
MNTYLAGVKNRKKVFVNDTEHEEMVSTKRNGEMDCGPG